MKVHLTKVSAAAIAAALVSSSVHAQDAGQQGAAPATAERETSGNGDIVVTAQKREQRLNEIPMSINAASADALESLGIQDTSDLAKIAPGFTATQTATSTPVYTIRGIGYYDSSIAATPAVTVYVDQVPLTYPVMTRNAIFDLERVEILKGPQGTLFGQNSTGGAVNYIAAKPTDHFDAGVDVSVGRFEEFSTNAFISGPLSDTLSVRVAGGVDSRGDWQRSFTRPDDERGQEEVYKGRLLLDWEPSSGVNLLFSASGWIDKSDTQAPQLIAKTSNLPPIAEFISYPLAPEDPRAADWSPGFRKARDDSFYQVALRADVDLSETLTLTSLTSYSEIDQDSPVDADGTALNIDNYVDRASANSFNQELRIEGDFGRTKLILGGSYGEDAAHQNTLLGVGDASTGRNNSLPGLPIQSIRFLADQDIQTMGLFGNIEYSLTDKLSLQAGVRYTEDERSFEGCLADVDGRLGPSIQFLANNILRPAQGIPGTISIPTNGCVSLDSTLSPGLAERSLKEDNVSFRFGPSFQLSPDLLLYANVSKGFKAGTFPTIGAVSASQFDPTTQESVLGYEAGFRAGLLDGGVQLNGAVFYYDYKDKQLLGSVIDPVFGPLQKLLNVPESRVQGAELQLLARPIDRLTLNLGVTYLDSEVTASFFNFNPYGTRVDFNGEAFPFTPKWQATADAEYSFPISTGFNGFVGGNVLYNSSTVGAFGADVPYNPNEPQHRNRFGQFPALSSVSGALDIDSYVLLNLRAGVETMDGRLRFSVWGQNVTDEYYWTNALFVPADATSRSAGLPATYGMSVNYRFGD